MLNIVQLPCALWNWVIMTSLEGNGICFQLLVFIFMLINEIALGLESFEYSIVSWVNYPPVRIGFG